MSSTEAKRTKFCSRVKELAKQTLSEKGFIFREDFIQYLMRWLNTTEYVVYGVFWPSLIDQLVYTGEIERITIRSAKVGFPQKNIYLLPGSEIKIGI